MRFELLLRGYYTRPLTEAWYVVGGPLIIASVSGRLNTEQWRAPLMSQQAKTSLVFKNKSGEGKQVIRERRVRSILYH